MALTLPNTLVANTPENINDVQENLEAIRDYINSLSSSIADNAITNAKMADLSVDTPELVDGAVETAKVNDLAITAGKLANSAVTPGKLGPIEGARVYRDTNLNLVDDTATAVDFTDSRWNNGACWEGVTNPGRLTAPRTGLYHIGAAVAIQCGNNSLVRAGARLMSSGGGIIAIDDKGPLVVVSTFAHSAWLQPQCVWYLAAGDYFTLTLYATHANTVTAIASSGSLYYGMDAYMHYLGPVA